MIGAETGGFVPEILNRGADRTAVPPRIGRPFFNYGCMGMQHFNYFR